MEDDNRQEPRRNYRYKFPGLRCPIKVQTVASDTFFTTAKSSHGNTCSQIFMGTISDRYSIYRLGKESQNGNTFQDYLKQVEDPPVVKTENA